MKTILASTYAVNPYKGSEDGMGWNFVYQIARYNKIIAITRKNNRSNIEKYMNENPSEIYKNIRFLYFDLPKYKRFWKKGSWLSLIYYQMWQREIIPFIQKQNLEFDIVHNINFHNDWTPSFLWKLNKPFVWGPIGHHGKIAKPFLEKFPLKEQLKTAISWRIKRFFWNKSAPLKATKEHASHVLYMNNSVLKSLNLINQRTSKMPSVAVEDNKIAIEQNKKEFKIISAGRLVHLKGFDLSIKAFANFLNQLNEKNKQNCQFEIIGSGPNLMTYKKLAKELGVEKYILFTTWVERKTLLQKMKKASAFMFPSHEGAGMVVAEALSFGLPVLCLDNDGPGEFITPECGFKINEKNYHDTILALSRGLRELFINPTKASKMSVAARKHYEAFFTWNYRGDELQKIYNSL